MFRISENVSIFDYETFRRLITLKNNSMKKTWVKIAAFALTGILFSASALNAQTGDDDKEKTKDKIKKDVQQIIITTKGDKENKYTVEIKGDKITVNGKSLEEYKNNEGDIKVNLRKLKDIESLSFGNGPGARAFFSGDGDAVTVFGSKGLANKAMLGVATEATDKGAVVKEVTKESAAEKIGLKAGDIITKIGDDKIETPDDLSEAVQKHKPGDKVDIKYTREGKEQKATAELTKWKGMHTVSDFPAENFNFDFKMMDDFKMPVMPKGFKSPAFAWSGNSPKLGLSVQDTDDGKGVKVIDVDEESNAAKAGIKEDDIITQVDDKIINGVDEIAKLLREKKDNPTVRLQLTRNGKSQTIEVKMPRKIKTADL
jgi:serine protease Do